MIEQSNIEIDNSIEDFLALEPTIFENQDPKQTLADVIDSFHTVTKRLNIDPTIRKNVKENPYYKYKVADPSLPGLQISVYTPVESRKPTIELMDNKNTKVLFRWTRPSNMYTEIKPIERHYDKGEYLEILQILIGQKTEERE